VAWSRCSSIQRRTPTFNAPNSTTVTSGLSSAALTVTATDQEWPCTLTHLPPRCGKRCPDSNECSMVILCDISGAPGSTGQPARVSMLVAPRAYPLKQAHFP
jgi:hypothetical protein